MPEKKRCANIFGVVAVRSLIMNRLAWNNMRIGELAILRSPLIFSSMTGGITQQKHDPVWITALYDTNGDPLFTPIGDEII